MEDKYGNPVAFVHDGVEVTNATFLLKHGESVTLTNIPVGAIVMIDEENGDYEVTATFNGEKLKVNKKGEMKTEVVDAEADTVIVNNDHTIPVPVGVALDSLPYILILVVVAAGGVFLFLRKRRNQED